MYAKITDSGLQFSDTQEDGYLEYAETVKPVETVMQRYKEAYTLSEDLLDSTQRIIQTWLPYILEPEGRVAKLVNGNQLSFPQQSEYAPDGSLMIGFNTRPNSVKLACGYLLIKETPKPDGNYREIGILVEDVDFGHKIEVVWEAVEPTPEQPFSISKIKLDDALLTLGVRDQFDAYIESNSEAKRRYDKALVLMSNDPMVVGAIAYFKQILTLNDDQIKNLLEGCKIDI